MDSEPQGHSFISESEIRTEMQKTHWISTILDKSSSIAEFKDTVSQQLEQHNESGQFEKPEQLTWQTMVQVMTHEMSKEPEGTFADTDMNVSGTMSEEKQAETRAQQKELNDKYNGIVAALISSYSERDIPGSPDIFNAYSTNLNLLGKKDFWKSSEKTTQFLGVLKKYEEQVSELGSFMYGTRDYDRIKDSQLSVRPSPAIGNTDIVEVAGYTIDRFNSVLNAVSLRTQMAQRAFNPPTSSNPPVTS